MDIADIIMITVCVPLIVIMGVLCYVLLALILKEEFDKIIWPFNKKEQESYWETLRDDVVLAYVCGECRYKSDRKYWYCPCCGKKMGNYKI
ncbi:MAG: hypothetical protein IJ880_16340 [Bacilli bacterium]|nr:hypothetical protein [Bacilli bacterium]